MINENDTKGSDWLKSQEGSTRHSYGTWWRYFLEFTTKTVGLNTGDQIISERENDKEHKWERLVLDFKKWLVDEKGLSQSSATSAAMAVRGFFSFHYKPLMYRAQESRKLRDSYRSTEDYLFSREDLKKMVEFANLKEKYILIAGKSFGLRAGDFLDLKRGELEPYISREVPISIGKINTGKENIPAYPFIDTDAQPIIKLMIEQMTRDGRTKPTDRMLSLKWEKELSQTLKRLAKRAGIETGNRQVRFHCLRKFLCDNLSRFMSESKWKQVVGKKIDEKAYISPESLREDYKRAMTETTFAKPIDETEIEMRATQRMLEMTLNMQNISEQVKATMRKKIWAAKRARELKPLEKEILEEIKVEAERIKAQTEQKKCTDGKHCQRIVTEPEAETLLNQGWHIITCLPSGKIVVSNDD
jgi:integrase